jgi:hypothetical protein
MYQAAGLAQLPRMPNMQATVMQRLRDDARPSGPPPFPRYGSPVTVPCACGCGEPVARQAAGRPARCASAACRMRAMRARRHSA